MNVIVWNVRGTASKAFVWHALELVKAHNLTILIFPKTKSSCLRADQVTARLVSNNFIFIPPFGKRGGIWLMRKKNH